MFSKLIRRGILTASCIIMFSSIVEATQSRRTGLCTAGALLGVWGMCDIVVCMWCMSTYYFSTQRAASNTALKQRTFASSAWHSVVFAFQKNLHASAYIDAIVQAEGLAESETAAQIEAEREAEAQLIPDGMTAEEFLEDIEANYDPESGAMRRDGVVVFFAMCGACFLLPIFLLMLPALGNAVVCLLGRVFSNVEAVHVAEIVGVSGALYFSMALVIICFSTLYHPLPGVLRDTDGTPVVRSLSIGEHERLHCVSLPP